MAGTPNTPSRWTVIGAYFALLAITAASLASPSDAPLHWALPSLLAILAVGILLLAPGLRPSGALGPKDVAVGLVLLQLLVFPTVLQAGLGYQGKLPTMPGGDALTWAIGIQVLAHLGMVIGLFVVVSKSTSDAPVSPVIQRRDSVKLLLALGVVGLFLRFPSLAAVADYYRGVDASRSIVTGEWLNLAGTLLLPCLGVGLIVHALNVSNDKGRFTLAALAFSGLGAASLALFSYNRASVLIPVLAMLAVYASRIRRVTLARGLVAAVVVGLLVMTLTDLRSTATEERLRQAGAEDTFSGYSLGLNELQLYGGAPQFLAIARNVTPPVDGGQLTLNALLSPVPRIGESARQANGVNTYNAALYGAYSQVADQSVPTAVELEWDFGPIGVLVGFILIGAFVGVLHRRFLRAPTLGQAFMWAFLGFWTAATLLLQLETVAQVFIYWSVPALILLTQGRRAPARREQIRPTGAWPAPAASQGGYR